MKTSIAAGIALLLYVAACAAAWIAWDGARAHEQQAGLIGEFLNPTHQADRAGRKLLEDLSLGLYDGYSRDLDALKSMRYRKSEYARTTGLATLAFFILIGVMLVTVALGFRTRIAFAYAALLASLPALVVGLAAPVLMIVAYQDVPLVGETVFRHQSKGVLTTLTTLYEHGNWIVAALLAMFSVIIPTLKTLILLGTGVARWRHIALRGLIWAKHIGKWSMADVFVVAMLMSFFATDQAANTFAELQAGLWFFTGYVVLSLLGAQLLAHPGDSRIPPTA
ncbi:MAG: paraquat-inducible protein A [Gammaproteobacteria bacterium]|nr:paraquat-inducible protein A [Gammaproteobacteria bacterium]